MERLATKFVPRPALSSLAQHTTVLEMVSAAHLVASKAYVVQRTTLSVSTRGAVSVDPHMYVKINVALPIALAARKSTTAVKVLRLAVIQRSAVMKNHLVAETPVNKVENVAMKKQWLVVVMGTVVPHLAHHSSMPYHVMKKVEKASRRLERNQ